MGPNAYPRTKSDVPKVPTSCPTPNSASTPGEAGLKILLPKVADREHQIAMRLIVSLVKKNISNVSYDARNREIYFFLNGQF